MKTLMKTLIKAAFLGLALLLTTVNLQAETVRLKTGAVLVGDVELVEGGDIKITTRFPESKTLILKQEDVDPRFYYDVLDRRSDPKDADARLRLGNLAESSGLYGLAISDYMAVAELRPELKRQLVGRIDSVREAIAAEILAEAKALLEEGSSKSALMSLHTLQELYPKTKAAKEAGKLLESSHKYAGYSADVAEKTVSVEKVPKVLESLQKDLDRAERENRKLGGHAGSSSRERRAADRAIRYFESAWEKIRSLPVAVSDSELRARIQRLRESGKERLVQAYLRAGTMHLQQYSIPRAEEYCNKACELSPGDKANHILHRLIVEAKINNGFGTYR